MGSKKFIESLESTEGLTASSLHQQVQDIQEAYYCLERDMEVVLGLLQGVVELHDDEEDLSSAVDKIKTFLDEEEM